MEQFSATSGDWQYGEVNNFPIKPRVPWRSIFAFVDTADYRADDIFLRAKLPVRFLRDEVVFDGNEYVIVFCSVRKKDRMRFLECMADLERAMIMEGHADYTYFCKGLYDALFNQGIEDVRAIAS